MDLAALKEIDIKDLFKKINIDPSIFKDKKTVTKIAIGAGSVIIFLIFYYFFLNPIVKEQEGRILVMEENIQKINEYRNNITQLKASIKKLEPDYEKKTKLFHSQKEVEAPYQNISNYALTNGLSIVNLNKKEAIAVGPNSQAVDQKNNNNNSGEANP